MTDSEDVRKESLNSNSILRWIGRLILVAIILSITSFFTPGFSIRGLWSYLVAAIVITGLDYLTEAFMGIDASPFGKGLKGFVITTVIIYLAQFIVPTMKVTILGAILAALVIGILDAVFPSRAM